QRRAKGDVDATFLTGDTLRDGGDILLLAFFITAFGRLLVHLPGLHRVTGIELIGNGDRHNAQAANVVAKFLLALIATHGEHLDNDWLSAINPVFGAPFALRDPDRRALLQQ